MSIHFSASKEIKAIAVVVNVWIEVTSVTRHRSSDQLSKEILVSGKIEDNQIVFFIMEYSHAFSLVFCPPCFPAF